MLTGTGNLKSSLPIIRLCNPVHPHMLSKTLPTHPCFPGLLIYQLTGPAGTQSRKVELQRPLPLLAWMWPQLLDGPCVQRSYRADTREKSRKIPRNGGRASSEKRLLDLEGSEQTLVSSLLPKSKRDVSSLSCTGFKVAEGPLQVSAWFKQCTYNFSFSRGS